MSLWRSDALRYGADYNPEQWPKETWHEDVRLMQEAGVNLVSLGIFAWSVLEPEPGRYDFQLLDSVIELLHEHGIDVDLATATASPPPWLSTQHPEILPVDERGTRLWHGSRQAYCPSSPVFRAHLSRLCEQLARRYGDHPAVVLWHVSNELGCHTSRCYCDVSATAFRRWLQNRYGDLDALNDAWGTSFWSQRYTAWDQVIPPRATPTFKNPGQQLDFARFSSDELIELYRMEREILREHSPNVPVTTNFMVGDGFDRLDYGALAPEQDVISTDHYLSAADPEAALQLTFCADRVRGFRPDEPWLLMEHSTSAVNWQPRNLAKAPGQMLRNSLAHVARGADGVLFFQWRASSAGAEKYHSAMVPHAGTDTKVWREVCELGAATKALAELQGSTVQADAAVVFDHEAWWACSLDAHPSVDVRYPEQARAWHAALTRRGVTVDVVPRTADLSRYRLVVVPTLYLVDDNTARSIAEFAEAGGQVLVTYFSGIVDEHDRIRLGGYPGAFRDLLGVRTEEFYPLAAGQTVTLDNGWRADVWTELTHATTASTIASYIDGPLPGVPAVTRRAVGGGAAWYAATRLGSEATQEIAGRLVAEAGIEPIAGVSADVEIVRRHGNDRSYLFVINHGDSPAVVEASGLDLLTGVRHERQTEVPAGAVAVLREERQ